ncbi:hypothetical protein niasHS_001477 [Heterodera schachtii]|uniref:Uncharacterized protein n=1 Tax=Heterodera schachtii TaxID=97005 RepID=A0ABD2KDK0_HETSC
MGCCGPKVVGVICCVLDILTAIFVFLGYTRESPTQRIVTGLYYLVLAVSCVMVIFAGDNASLFRPFLVLKPVILIELLMICILFVSILLNEPLSEERSGLIFTLVVCLLITALFAWFYSIIFRAYVELAEKSAPDNANLDAAGPTCCCGPLRAKIETGIPVFALIGFSFLLSEARAIFIYECKGCSTVHVSLGYLCLASAIAYLVVIFAQRDRNPSLFLPYLIIMPIILIMHLWDIALVLVIILESSLEGYYRVIPLTMPLLFAYVIFPALHIWFYSLIFRAYNRTKQQMFSRFIAYSSRSRAEESRVGP